MKTNIGITGSRYGGSNAQLSYMYSFLDRHPGSILHQGCCTGVDAEATIHVKNRCSGWTVHGYPPLNRTFLSPIAVDLSDYLAEPTEYVDRNQAIVNACELLIAFPKSVNDFSRSGTMLTVKYAAKNLRDYVIVFPDGTLYKSTRDLEL